MRSVRFAQRPVADSKVKMRFARRSRIIEPSVRRFAVRVTKLFLVNFGYREMREINRIAENAQRNERKFIQIRAPFKENKLESEPLARIRLAVSGVIPPFGLRVLVRVQIARQFDRVEFCSVA